MSGQACVDRCAGSQAAAQRKGQDPRLVGGCAQRCERPNAASGSIQSLHNTTPGTMHHVSHCAHCALVVAVLLLCETGCSCVQEVDRYLHVHCQQLTTIESRSDNTREWHKTGRHLHNLLPRIPIAFVIDAAVQQTGTQLSTADTSLPQPSPAQPVASRLFP